MKLHLLRSSIFNRPVNHDIFSDSAVNSSHFLGLVACKPAFIYERHIQALTRVLKFHYKRKRIGFGSFRINLFLDRFLTKKAIGVRMGKGKGAVSDRVFFMRPGFFILYINDANRTRASYVLKKCCRRIPVPCQRVLFGSW